MNVNAIKRGLSIFLVPIFAAAVSFAQGIPVAQPETVGVDAHRLGEIDRVVKEAIEAKKMPGAVVIFGHKGKIVYRKAFGNRSLVPAVEPMTVDTIFDVASLTKPIATATSIMVLMEQGKLRLNDTIGMYIPDLDDENAKKVTILQLLTHTSGYRPDFDLGEKWIGREGMLAALKREKLINPAGTKFVYSDIGFIVLGEIVDRLGNMGINGFFNDSVLMKIQLKQSKYKKFSFNDFRNAEKESSFCIEFIGDAFHSDLADVKGLCPPVAPTENIKGQNSYLGSSYQGNAKDGEKILRGQVHDPTAFRMGGVAGHAGLFSTADDLARYAQMMLNNGVIDGKRVLSPQTVAKMTSPYVVSEDGMARGLGWDMNTGFSSNRGELFPVGSFGHTGFTGTSIWIDPATESFVIFMSNRVHPDGKGDVTPVRARVATIAASAIDQTNTANIKQQEIDFNAAVSAQLPKFKEHLKKNTSTPKTDENKVATRTVLNGIDVLKASNFAELAGKKIGLVTNHTGRDLAGKPTIDVLFEAKNLQLVSLFAPEHGIRGELDQEKIDDSKDEKTGLPVYSLYKDGMRRPKPEQLKGLDAIVYDIQDIGARFYTYTATLKNVMEEAAKLDIPIYVLDRPNPINGNDVEGPLADEGKLAFIAAHTIPVRYGLTIGELGMMMNAERKIGAKLNVIKMQNWSRSLWFDQTSQTWINPSPNMRSLTQATLYPGIGLLETTNVSVGRGTDTPFEVVGAPYIDGRKLAEHLNKRNIPGVRFVPIRFKPNASVFKGEELGGINIVITDREVFQSVYTGFEIAAALRSLYRNEWQADRYSRLLVNGEFLEKLKQGTDARQMRDDWKKQIADFEKRRASYLLY